MPAKPDYDRVCVKCTFHENDRKRHMCTKPRHIITGKPILLSCETSRSRIGHCGPSGRCYEQAKVKEAAE